MKYTKEQLEAMSDFEINKALCLKLGLDVSGVDEQRNMMTGVVLDFCQIWNYIMPLAVEHDVTYIKSYQTAYSKLNGDKHDKMYTDKPPQRAIACCLLMMEFQP